jgi:hypothetical protein
MKTTGWRTYEIRREIEVGQEVRRTFTLKRAREMGKYVDDDEFWYTGLALTHWFVASSSP